MTDIERRLQYLEDEQAILDTLYGYGHGLDYGHEDAWIDCWTEDAILDWPGRALMRGHAELRAGFRNHTHAPQAFHKHVVVEPRIVIEGDRATVTSMYARLDRYEGGPKIRAFGRYRDTLVRCKDGRWRIKERYPEIESIRKEAPIGVEPFPDSPEARKAMGVAVEGKS
jgi:ketosteroid isomerase-like protein